MLRLTWVYAVYIPFQETTQLTKGGIRNNFSRSMTAYTVCIEHSTTYIGGEREVLLRNLWLPSTIEIHRDV